MTVYAPSDFASVTVPADERGGCGQPHFRDTGPDGYPVQPWALTCPGCETYLLVTDGRWVKDPMDIPPTFDEKRAADRFKERGAADKDALLVLAMSRMAGLSPAEIPPSLSKMLSGLPAHVPGVTVCASGHDNVPGSRFCRDCGTPMTRPAAVAAVTSGAPA